MLTLYYVLSCVVLPLQARGLWQLLDPGKMERSFHEQVAEVYQKYGSGVAAKVIPVSLLMTNFFIMFLFVIYHFVAIMVVDSMIIGVVGLLMAAFALSNFHTAYEVSRTFVFKVPKYYAPMLVIESVYMIGILTHILTRGI